MQNMACVQLIRGIQVILWSCMDIKRHNFCARLNRNGHPEARLRYWLQQEYGWSWLNRPVDSPLRKTLKWYRTIALHFLDLVMTNAYLLYESVVFIVDTHQGVCSVPLFFISLSCFSFSALISRAHSFPRKNLTKFRGEFRKFHGSPRQHRWNSAAHRGNTSEIPRLD